MRGFLVSSPRSSQEALRFKENRHPFYRHIVDFLRFVQTGEHLICNLSGLDLAKPILAPVVQPVHRFGPRFVYKCLRSRAMLPPSSLHVFASTLFLSFSIDTARYTH